MLPQPIKNLQQKARDCSGCAKRREAMQRNKEAVKDAWKRFRGS